MQIELDHQSATPVFQQIVSQIQFAIQTGTLAADARLPSIRGLATEHGLAPNTVAKAYRQLEFRGLIAANDRSGFVVATAPENAGGPGDSRYQARGVSADKTEVHAAVDHIDPGIFPGAFCRVTEDFLSGDPEACNVIHADGAGTKSIVAYLAYKESGDARVFHGIAQDSIVMNLDDLLCVGMTGRVLISNTVNRNAINCPGEVVSALIEGTEQFLATLRDHGVPIYSGGGETADVGDLTGTVVVDSCAVGVMKKRDVIAGQLHTDLAIVGFASTGQADYEDRPNSGMGSNGLTSARHDMLSPHYAEHYPESFDPNVSSDLTYCGPYRLEDALPDSDFTVGEAILSPTRTYAPVIARLLQDMRSEVAGIIHCSGGAQTKCLKFGSGVHFVKDNLFPTPPLFSAIQAASGTSWQEMYKVFNMGHRMEVYVPQERAAEVIDIAGSLGVAARQVGHTRGAASNQLTLTSEHGTFEYAA